MSEATGDTAPKQTKPKKPAAAPVGKMNLAEVDAEFTKLDAVTKRLNETVKSALSANQNVAVDDLRQLQRQSHRRMQIIVRRVALLASSPDTAVKDLLDKLMKVKPKVEA